MTRAILLAQDPTPSLRSTTKSYGYSCLCGLPLCLVWETQQSQKHQGKRAPSAASSTSHQGLYSVASSSTSWSQGLTIFRRECSGIIKIWSRTKNQITATYLASSSTLSSTGEYSFWCSWTLKSPPWLTSTQGLLVEYGILCLSSWHSSITFSTDRFWASTTL